MPTINGKPVSKIALCCATLAHNNQMTEAEAAMLATLTGIMHDAIYGPPNPVRAAIRQTWLAKGHTVEEFNRFFLISP